MLENIWFSTKSTMNCARQQWRRRNPSEAGIPLTCMQSQQQWPRPCMNEFPGATVTWETIVPRVQPSASLGVECRCILHTDIHTYILVTAHDASPSEDLVTVGHELHEHVRNSYVYPLQPYHSPRDRWTLCVSRTAENKSTTFIRNLSCEIELFLWRSYYIYC